MDILMDLWIAVLKGRSVCQPVDLLRRWRAQVWECIVDNEFWGIVDQALIELGWVWQC